MRARLTSGKTPFLIGLMAAVLAVSFVMPALGGPSVNKAFKKAKAALSKAKKAQKSANQAQDSANQALAEPDLIGARAFARFVPIHGGSGATVDTARSSPGVSVTEQATSGIYCVRFPGLSSASAPAVATADNFASNTAAAIAQVNNPSTCPTSSDFEIRALTEGAGSSGFAALTDFVDGVNVAIP
jgi:hypothetical protein